MVRCGEECVAANLQRRSVREGPYAIPQRQFGLHEVGIVFSCKTSGMREQLRLFREVMHLDYRRGIARKCVIAKYAICILLQEIYRSFLTCHNESTNQDRASVHCASN